jgi:glycosyltransferase involved in cell wall biosynthesis
MIQIPCLNETGTLTRTFADLPRQCEGIDEIEVLVIDDGSSDGTAEFAEKLGVHHIIRFPQNRGLAAGFMAGVDACLRLGADIIVNTDADNQYRGADIPRIVAPIVEGRADLVIGDRQTDTIEHFSFVKRVFQRWGSFIVRKLSASDVADSPSGFRAISRSAALQLIVHNRFTYTLETVIQAGRRGLALANVPIVTNPKTREPRLFRSTPDYLRRAGPVMLRAYAMYCPVQLFSYGACALLLFGMVVGIRFLYHYFQNPNYSGFTQSLVVGTAAVVLACVMLIAAMLAELLAANRRLLEESLMRVRRLESHAGSELRPRVVEGVHSTGVSSWRPLSYSGHAEPVKKAEHG